MTSASMITNRSRAGGSASITGTIALALAVEAAHAGGGAAGERLAGAAA